MNSHDLSTATWRKSSHSGSNGGDCIEIAPEFAHIVPVRDSKNPDGPALVFPTPAWATFLAAIKRDGETLT